MQLSDYTYQLPQDLIADFPPEQRGSTRLLVLDRVQGTLTDQHYQQLDELLRPGDVLIINDTKVIKARLLVKTIENSDRELLILEKHGRNQNRHRLSVMFRGKLHPGMILKLAEHTLCVDSVDSNGTAIVSSTADILFLADQYGSVPLPPYMHRQATEQDSERYQTVFAKQAGSVAAPTASLNLTNELLQKIRTKHIQIATITLHVGLGTFMPIRTEDITKHHMHQEYFHIPLATIEAIRSAKSAGGRVIAVGTTVTRTLEFAAKMIDRATSDIIGEADIFIYPGYSFRLIDAMVTNFHAPHSTVLMMVAAFAGWDNLKRAYEHAIDKRYQFLSYGDSMFIA
ncbi:MAG: tRNA preQ1(34) S-adenosylmethionine ribosyltransferase-isomerase QueA [Candidatus Saccharimonadales bacterium]